MPAPLMDINGFYTNLEFIDGPETRIARREPADPIGRIGTGPMINGRLGAAEPAFSAQFPPPPYTPQQMGTLFRASRGFFGKPEDIPGTLRVAYSVLACDQTNTEFDPYFTLLAAKMTRYYPTKGLASLVDALKLSFYDMEDHYTVSGTPIFRFAEVCLRAFSDSDWVTLAGAFRDAMGRGLITGIHSTDVSMRPKKPKPVPPGPVNRFD